VVDEPMITSAWSSSISLRMLATARVLSPPSSSTVYSMVCPATSLGIRGNELRCGMPSDAAGPVVEMVTPTWMTSARAAPATHTAKAAPTKNPFNLIMRLFPPDAGMPPCLGNV
jgi:hypothetical protein